MPKGHLVTSIAMPEATFAGASQIGCIRRWTPNQFADESTGTTHSFHASVRRSPGLRLKFELESTGESLAFVPDDVVRRVLCHVLIERLPADAIQQVWEDVYDVWKWH